MFHMLGRFALTSSFSSRSSRDCPMGSTRFGFCCERGALNFFTISTPFHPLFPIQGYRLGCSLAHLGIRKPNRSLAMFRDTHMGSVLAEPHVPLSEGISVASSKSGMPGY